MINRRQFLQIAGAGTAGLITGGLGSMPVGVFCPKIPEKERPAICHSATWRGNTQSSGEDSRRRFGFGAEPR